MTSETATFIENGVMEPLPCVLAQSLDFDAASDKLWEMTGQHPIVLDDKTTDAPLNIQTHASDALLSGKHSSEITSQTPMVIDDEALKRPPYTGIEQWATMQQVAARGPTVATSKGTTSPPQTSPVSGSSSSQDLRRRTASAYLQLPVPQPEPVLWHVPSQPVCKGAAKPTPVCGKWSAARRDPPRKPWRNNAGRYKCPRCHCGYANTSSLRCHFPRCVALNGNPKCDAWTDDDSYTAGGAGGASKGSTHLVTLGIAELVVRLYTHPEWMFYPLEPPPGVEPANVETKEEEEEAWERIKKSMKEDARNDEEISPEMAALMQSFNDEDQGDTESADEGCEG